MTLIQNRSDPAIEQIIKGELINHGIPAHHENHKRFYRKLSAQAKRINKGSLMTHGYIDQE